MQISLHSQKTIKEVKKEFHSVFPFLKLEFFRVPHKPREGTPVQEEVPACTQLIEVSGVLRESPITIEPSDTVREVEQRFQQNYGLPVQVFRKVRSIWIETTATDHLTLKEQNDMGRRADELIPERREEAYGMEQE